MDRETPVHAPLISDGFLNGVIANQDYDCANDGNAEAVDIDAGHAVGSEETEKPSSDDGTDDPQDDIEEETFSRFVDDLASDETGNQTQHNPRQD
jgi:hypothetical protein